MENLLLNKDVEMELRDIKEEREESVQSLKDFCANKGLKDILRAISEEKIQYSELEVRNVEEAVKKNHELATLILKVYTKDESNIWGGSEREHLLKARIDITKMYKYILDNELEKKAVLYNKADLLYKKANEKSIRELDLPIIVLRAPIYTKVIGKGKKLVLDGNNRVTFGGDKIKAIEVSYEFMYRFAVSNLDKLILDVFRDTNR